jgi:hypothetical protein
MASRPLTTFGRNHGFSHWNLPIEYRRYIVKLSTIGIPWTENGVDGENYWKKTIVKIGKTVTIWEKRRLYFVDREGSGDKNSFTIKTMVWGTSD